MCLGIPGQIISVDDRLRKLGTVDVAGVRRQVNLACVINETLAIDDAVGEWVLVHVGFAMSRISEKEAELTLQVLIELGEAQAEIAAMRQSAGHTLQ